MSEQGYDALPEWAGDMAESAARILDHAEDNTAEAREIAIMTLTALDYAVEQTESLADIEDIYRKVLDGRRRLVPDRRHSRHHLQELEAEQSELWQEAVAKLRADKQALRKALSHIAAVATDKEMFELAMDALTDPGTDAGYRDLGPFIDGLHERYKDDPAYRAEWAKLEEEARQLVIGQTQAEEADRE